ncbi:MAG TPA: 23S rRNA (uracil(1939)-C(5))-methyltransferase RlmD [Methylomirabilota bacterium]|jgi:23S rRNA (uracil1939-C5)-methyltransferase|nr:23S rRNA (uracil(1939)-C(5))-methyltransferase RlmD [Methylomirabilota bacterium]
MAHARRGDLLTVDVTDLAFGGEGVARAGGYVVFVPGGVPGDRLDVRLTQVRPRFARGQIERVVTPSGLRAEPPCPYFGRCGGCRLQHVRYEAQLAFKQRQVAECLARLGGLGPAEEIPVRPIVGAPEIYGYRNKMEFTFAEADGRAVVGLHEAERYDAILDIERCLIQSETLNAVLREVRAFVHEHGGTVYRQDREEGLLRFLMLREGRATGEAMVNLVTASHDLALARALADHLRARCPQVTSVVLNVNPKKAAVAVGVEEHPIAGHERIRERLGGLDFSISANSFFQTNTPQAERLFSVVAEYAALTGREVVFDLYSGTGAISLLLARQARAVYGIEVVPAAIDDATRNATANGIGNCTFLAGEVRDVLPDLVRQGIRAHVVVADPPRAGFHPKALRAVLALAPERIVYVSCNPATLARDLGIVRAGGYRITAVQPLDMFPHTPHIEVVARLERAP